MSFIYYVDQSIGTWPYGNMATKNVFRERMESYI